MKLLRSACSPYTRNMLLASSLLTVCMVSATAQAVPATTGSSVPPAQAQAALDFHNAKRHDVGVPPLQWSPQLAAAAQQWANHLAASGCAFDHTPNNRYGENLFAGNGVPYNPLDAAKDWYAEIAKFHYGVLTGNNWYVAGHYTQMVWRNTTQLGIGQSTCKDGSSIIVAEYDPPGNYIGQAPY